MRSSFPNEEILLSSDHYFISRILIPPVQAWGELFDISWHSLFEDLFRYEYTFSNITSSSTQRLQAFEGTFLIYLYLYLYEGINHYSAVLYRLEKIDVDT